ncbi:MAG TPA: hypothetical protein VFQ79_10835 [Bryobacteraceae bacterium]|nr:hypothetical protein [Bryobacteraceae bacterium]
MPRMLMLALAALSGCGIVGAQTYNKFYTPGSGWDTYWAYCQGLNTGQIVYNCPLMIETANYPGTNAHYHYNPPAYVSNMICVRREQQCSPYSGTRIYGNTSSFGSVPFDLYPGQVGQAERVAATATETGKGNYLDYVVGYKDIYWNDHPEIWQQVGGSTTNHGDNQYNHWMKSAPAYRLYDCTLEYLATFQQQKICTNDMSLPFGGVFDLNNNWYQPHTFHRKGDSVDIPTTAANQCPSYKVPDANAPVFLNMCINKHQAMPVQGNCGGSCIESNHIHFRWNVP